MGKYCSAECLWTQAFRSTEAELGSEKQSPQAQVPEGNKRGGSTPAQTDSFPNPCGVLLPSEFPLPSPLSRAARTDMAALSSGLCHHAHTDLSTQRSWRCLFGINGWLLYLCSFHPPTATPLKHTSPMNSFPWPWEIGPISSGASNIILTIGIFTKGREVGYLAFAKQGKLSDWIQSQDKWQQKAINSGPPTRYRSALEQPLALNTLSQQCLWHSQWEGREEMKAIFAGVNGLGQLWLGESGRN